MNPLHFLLSVNVVLAQQYYCPSYTHLPYEGEKCFLISERPEDFKMDFVGAQKACQTLGGSLASITSKAEDDFVIGSAFSAPNTTFRTVSSDHWIDGSLVDFTKYPAGKDIDTLFKYPTAFMSTINFAGWSSQSETWQGGFVCSTMFRPLPANLAASYCPYGGQAVTELKTFGVNGCHYGFYKPKPGNYCCPICPKGGEVLFASPCPPETHAKNSFNNYCCPKIV